MQITQSYAKPSTSKTDSKGTHFSFSQELSRRNPVSLHAMINYSLAYAKLMLALRKVVVGDWRSKQRDHTRYQEWVQQQYLKELPDYFSDVAKEKLKLVGKKALIGEQIKELNFQLQPLQKMRRAAEKTYREYIRKFEKEKLWVLDPVISVHPDCVIFEAFSLDESSYGRVSVPTENLEIFGDVDYGTTNIDFSQQLADEIYRVRSYRPAWLKVAYDQVEMSTGVGSQVEKKIDLPETWVRGFLQVQSASTMPGTNVTLSAQTFNEILSILEQNKAKVSPRSLRFRLVRGEKPIVVLDPWGIEVREFHHIYRDNFEGEIRIWGRRRLSVFNDVLPFADTVEIKLLGTGMPSYWSVGIDGHRFDVGLSGWTANDWAQKASFDLLASAGSDKISEKTLENALNKLIQKLAATPAELGEWLSISQKDATFALQELCRNGQAMFDHLTGKYRWRELLSQAIEVQDSENDERLKYALELKKSNKVSLKNETKAENLTTCEFEIQGKKLFKTQIATDNDGRVKRAECTCGFFRHNKLRKGPCQHILASVISTL
ncbi:SWIM zinc finger domain-containing protein [Saprospiraceae bacterium]|jgi:hypothetical protein|nr:SWIM zinc finger domain-containing protein [Saprospiraceae bacterium]MDF1863737.1 SWIM zinc finger domain-containing protein [Saprospiraceae bacterium]